MRIEHLIDSPAELTMIYWLIDNLKLFKIIIIPLNYVNFSVESSVPLLLNLFFFYDFMFRSQGLFDAFLILYDIFFKIY